MSGSADLIDVVESAYRLDLDDHAWLGGVTRAAEACLDIGIGLMGYTFDLGRWPAIDFDSVVTVNFPPETAEAAVPMLRRAPPASARAIMQMNCSTISQHLGDPATVSAEAHAFYRETYYPRDAFGVVATGPERYGVVLSTLPSSTQAPATGSYDDQDRSPGLTPSVSAVIGMRTVTALPSATAIGSPESAPTSRISPPPGPP